MGGDRCVGEAGPLSPDDSERFRDVKLRLVWSRDECLVMRRNSDDFLLLSAPSLLRLFLLRRAILVL